MEKDTEKMKITGTNAHSDLGRNKDHFYFQRDSRGHNLTGRFLSNADFGDSPHEYETLPHEHSNIGLYLLLAIFGVALFIIV